MAAFAESSYLKTFVPACLVTPWDGIAGEDEARRSGMRQGKGLARQ